MRYLFASLSSYGFLYPSIGLAQELAKRGHDVAFATGDIFAQTLAAAGLERIPRGDHDGPSFDLPTWHNPLSAALQVKHLEYAIARFHPDALVGQMLTLGAFLTAERQGLPLAVLALGYYPYQLSSWSMLAHLSPAERHDYWLTQGMQSIYNRSRVVCKLPPAGENFTETPLLGHLFMVRSIPQLEDLADLPERVHLVGACLWEPESCADAELAAWLREAEDAELPVIYVQHGRTFNLRGFWEDLAEALQERPVRVAASAEKLELEHRAIPAPANFLVRGHIPQGLVLPNAKAVVCSGSTTAALGAVTAGLPSLMIPTGSDQPDIAMRYRLAGAARQIDISAVSPALLQRAIDDLLHNDVLRRRADELKAEFAAWDGFVRAADLVETLVLSGKPVLRSESKIRAMTA